MTRTVPTTLTAEQRRERATALQASIAEQVDALRDTARWQAFCDSSRSLLRYSLNNVLLILAQNPEATQVEGFRAWKEHGRKVRKGEKSLKIFGFAKKKITDPDAEDDDLTETDEAGQRYRIWYPVLSVFDISQTEPIDPSAAGPGELVVHLTGADPLDILGAVADYVTAEGWTFTREPIPGPANGYTTTDGTRRIVVDADLSPAQAAKTALHEAAHAYLHADLTPAERAEVHRGIRETEAESVAYVVAGVLGLDTAAYTIGYVAGWADADNDLIRATAANVLHAAQHIADAITATQDTVAV